MDNSASSIYAEDLTKRFGDFTAVDEVNFSVAPGQIFGFLGPNGSGKTTTIRMLLGLMKPSSGSASVLGYQVERDAVLIRPRVGYMSQRFSLYNDLSVMQNLRFYGTAYGLSNAELGSRVREAIERSGLTGREDAKTGDLSGGWRQRLALSAAILHRPEALFLDEPTAGVDPVSRRAFWELLNEFVAEGITIFVTTHYMDEAEHCQRLAFLQHGRIIANGSPGQIKAEEMRGQVLEIEPSDATAAVKVLREAMQSGGLPLEAVELYGSLVHVVAKGMKKRQRAIAGLLREAGLKVERKAIIEPSLEDVFISCMKN
jgi:ABC-2 type transport system ATP-binding protein